MEENNHLDKLYEARIKEYYRKFDQRQPMEVFEQDFHWDDLLISSPSSNISTKEEYAAFYSEVTEAYIDSHHQVDNFIITHQSDDLVNVACDVVFTAKQKPALTSVEVAGRIQFSFRPALEEGVWKISRYLISVK
ncbi:nuclear transport factor 2 family protein [Vibrio alginolyticus]|nr:nuclear transport factor 2 family protein [Vibrio alginolyticus]ELA6610319.1 nuclear transport factor 2 family protein [Vibrio alginolyticus]